MARDVEQFPGLSYEIEGDVPPVERVSHSMFVEHSWEAPHVRVDAASRERPDVWQIRGVRLLTMRREVAEELMPFVAMSGELLPLRSGEEALGELYALNIVNLFDAVDRARSDLGRGDVAFIGHRLGEPTLFTVPQLAEIFCLERDDVDDSFLRRYEVNGFTGLSFELVWSSERKAPEPRS